jgi:hypothetical protein
VRLPEKQWFGRLVFNFEACFYESNACVDIVMST